MEPGTIIAQGTIENSPEGIYMTSNRVKDMLCWVAIRGKYHEWAIYCYWSEFGFQYALVYGPKLTDPKNIRKLVPCTDEALKMYRN